MLSKKVGRKFPSLYLHLHLADPADLTHFSFTVKTSFKLVLNLLLIGLIARRSSRGRVGPPVSASPRLARSPPFVAKASLCTHAWQPQLLLLSALRRRYVLLDADGRANSLEGQALVCPTGHWERQLCGMRKTANIIVSPIRRTDFPPQCQTS